MSTPQKTSILVNGTKTFVPLENNPVVFSHLIRALGVSPKLSFYDVYSIDELCLIGMIPRPVYALIFICPGTVYHTARDAELAQMEAYSGSGEYPVMWFKQTIREACGLMGLLHAVCNGGAKQYIQPGSPLDKFRAAAIPLKTAERAELLYNSKTIEEAHAAAAQLGDTEAPALGVDAEGHFICFVKGDDGHLWELCGAKGPIDHGELAPHDDALSEKSLQLGVRTFLDKAGGDLRFSIVALAPSEE